MRFLHAGQKPEGSSLRVLATFQDGDKHECEIVMMTVRERINDGQTRVVRFDDRQHVSYFCGCFDWAKLPLMRYVAAYAEETTTNTYEFITQFDVALPDAYLAIPFAATDQDVMCVAAAAHLFSLTAPPLCRSLLCTKTLMYPNGLRRVPLDKYPQVVVAIDEVEMSVYFLATMPNDQCMNASREAFNQMKTYSPMAEVFLEMTIGERYVQVVTVQEKIVTWLKKHITHKQPEFMILERSVHGHAECDVNIQHLSTTVLGPDFVWDAKQKWEEQTPMSYSDKVRAQVVNITCWMGSFFGKIPRKDVVLKQCILNFFSPHMSNMMLAQKELLGVNIWHSFPRSLGQFMFTIVLDGKLRIKIPKEHVMDPNLFSNPNDPYSLYLMEFLPGQVLITIADVWYSPVTQGDPFHGAHPLYNQDPALWPTTLSFIF